MRNGNCKCFFCGNTCDCQNHRNYNGTFYDCNICGYYVITVDIVRNINKNLYALFMYHNCKLFPPTENYISFFGSPEAFQVAIKECPDLIFISDDAVKAWFPQNFSEKIDTILIGLASLSNYESERIILSPEEKVSLFFGKRYKDDNQTVNADYLFHPEFFLKYMQEEKLIISQENYIMIYPEGWKRIDDLQKNMTNSKQAFVAMPFSDETKKIREAIRKGVEKAGYIVQIIDEKEHNKQIVPEILYEIRKSKFLIAELTGHNTGVYYEAGYAEGLGKEVILVCNTKAFGEKGHFDIKQKSSILWNTEDEITEKLYKRIIATVY